MAEIITLSAEYRLPTVYQWKEHVEAGGLISYGPSLEAVWRQAATLVAKILNGTKPADLPVEEPAKLELAVNARTAKALGITIPTSVLIQADQMIGMRRRHYMWQMATRRRHLLAMRIASSKRLAMSDPA